MARSTEARERRSSSRRDGEGSFFALEPFAVFHAELEGRYTSAMERRMKVYYHQIALEYGDPPTLALAFFKKGGPKAVEKREIVRRVKSWVSSRYAYKAVCLSKCRAEKYLEKNQPVAAALASLMNPNGWNRVEHKLRCLKAVSRSDIDEERRYLLTNVIDIYLPWTRSRSGVSGGG